MKIEGQVAVVTGGASGLGRACAERLAEGGATIFITDLPTSAGEDAAAAIGRGCRFVPGNVRSEEDMRAVFEQARQAGPVRATVHCAGRGGPVRVLDKEGRPGSLATYEEIVQTNLIGSFNVLRLAAEAIARTEPADGERGVIVLTASVAAFEGQIGQIPYASSKAGVVGMTLVAARDLASRLIRVCTVAPGTFDTPLLARVPDAVRAELGRSVPHPARLGAPSEFAALVEHVIANPMLNGETIRLDGAIRMPPR
ncbi:MULTISPECIES: SDR family NAD(P)-dependent oxidoreductase [Sphingomonadales]|uniref:Short-chain dehydrogenase/reductase SDR n=1 Tax=Rhizorhabdus wittichii (strain DSM 6014 / CCUG 31198 / JCM 15750 / NBRC 105917 / EY 4224 / RW1) TaxID=392499 RepID=A0A9J9LES8_RHIWR|nr:short-chain dehydrogenase/reductase SDR [Rhizorhabdus wittichii RW1]